MSTYSSDPQPAALASADNHRMLRAQPLTPEAFAPYGDVISYPVATGRAYFEQALGNLREHATPSLSTTLRPPMASSQRLSVELLERHEYSSQTFLPLGDVKWLIVVCPHHPDGGPDSERSVAFIANGRQGVTYRPDTWHHGLTVLEGTGQFAVFMWRDGTQGDEEFVKIKPFDVILPT